MNSKHRFRFPSLENDLMARVFNREPLPRVPVWMMRQAGRCDPQYRRLREEDGRPLEELFMDAEISVRISLLPRRFGVDAIIMFQDILTPLAAMGAGFHFVPSPLLKDPIRSLGQDQSGGLFESPRTIPGGGSAVAGNSSWIENARGISAARLVLLPPAALPRVGEGAPAGP